MQPRTAKGNSESESDSSEREEREGMTSEEVDKGEEETEAAAGKEGT